MVKKKGLIIIVILSLLVVGLGVLGGLLWKGIITLPSGEDLSSISSNINLSSVSTIFSKIDLSSKDFIPSSSEVDFSYIVFIIQWAILLLIIFIAYIRFLKRRKMEKITGIPTQITRKKTRSETNLDVFYNLLKDKKSLSIKTVAKLFKVSREKALEWAKILENHELVTIEYPTFSVPEVKINEKEIKTPEKTKAKEKAREKTKKVVKTDKGSKETRKEPKVTKHRKKKKIKRRKK